MTDALENEVRRGDQFGDGQRMNEDQSSAGIVRVFGQLMTLPISAFIYGIDMLIKTMQQMQRVTNQGLGAVVGPEPVPVRQPENHDGNDLRAANSLIDHSTADRTTIEEEKLLMYDNNNHSNGLDKNLRDDMLKLVRYKILFVKREFEYAFPEQEDLVYDNMDGNAFTAWKVAEFIQELAKVKDEKTAEGRARVGIRIPHKWKHYPRPEDRYTFDGYLTGFPAGRQKIPARFLSGA